MKVAVTGGTGFIGGRVVRILRERGHEVTCVVRSPDKAKGLAALGATLCKGDILDKTSLEMAFAGAEGVLHIAASYELGVVGKAQAEALAKNLEGTKAALEAAVSAGAKKIVYTSSIVVYGNTRGEVVAEGWRPASMDFPGMFPTFYAYSKARAHYDVALPMIAAGAPIVIVQPGGVYGPRDHSTFRVMWACLAKGLPVPLGRAVYGVVDVEDCAMGHVLALEQGKIGECYHLVDETLSLPDFLDKVAAASGMKATKIVLPAWLLGINAAMTSIVERIIPLPDILSSDATRGMSGGLTLSVTLDKARKELGWTPRPAVESMREMMADELVRRGKKLPPLLEGVRPRA
jgi:dihydroflavonol-4-reductase